MSQQESKFLLKKTNIIAAANAFSKYLADNDLIEKDEQQIFTKEHKALSFLKKALKDNGWIIDYGPFDKDADGNLIHIEFSTDWMGFPDGDPLDIIAPFVEKGSYIQFMFDDYAPTPYRLVFTGKECIENQSKIVWDDPDSL